MECFFREHMAEHDPVFHDSAAETVLSRSFPSESETGLSQLISSPKSQSAVPFYFFRRESRSVFFPVMTTMKHIPSSCRMAAAYL